jgi:hypothetical protein
MRTYSVPRKTPPEAEAEANDFCKSTQMNSPHSCPANQMNHLKKRKTELTDSDLISTSSKNLTSEPQFHSARAFSIIQQLRSQHTQIPISNIYKKGFPSPPPPAFYSEAYAFPKERTANAIK